MYSCAARLTFAFCSTRAWVNSCTSRLRYRAWLIGKPKRSSDSVFFTHVSYVATTTLSVVASKNPRAFGGHSSGRSVTTYARNGSFCFTPHAASFSTALSAASHTRSKLPSPATYETPVGHCHAPASLINTFARKMKRQALAKRDMEAYLQAQKNRIRTHPLAPGRNQARAQAAYSNNVGFGRPSLQRSIAESENRANRYSCRDRI